ncbi:type VI secretion system Vgr family protein [Serratia microhaemolytica]|uniref:type VI secretion system Vgr family protein n=1 Tax=Serratia microhaemolytica TaxID=2675110 RepID=UPI000FDD9F0E|nr:type VI secretion system tip protein TssI/VgrG [Serratia microhaemolytica]
MQDNGVHFNFNISGLPPDTFVVSQFTLDEALSELFTLSLTLTSARDDLPLEKLLLKPGSFTFSRAGVVQRTVNGIVGRMTQSEHHRHYTVYRVTLRPAMLRLTMKRDSRIFQQKTVPEILDLLLTEHNVVNDKKFYDEHPVRTYVTQKRESDYEFFCRLAAEEGICFWFEEQKVAYSDDPMAMLKGPEVVFNPDTRTVIKDDVMTELHWERIAQPVSTVQKDHWYGHPDYEMRFSCETVPKLGYGEWFESTGRFQDGHIGEQFTRYRRDRLVIESQHGAAKSNSIQLMPGRRFDLTGHPIDARNAYYQVVSVHHHGQVPEASNGNPADSGTTFYNHLHLVNGFDTWRAPFCHKPLADGDEVATVVGPPGEEIFVNELGEIKVHFHWNRYDKPNDRASCWVRVAQAWNGSAYGFMAIPRIGQEVIISYLNGDIDRPIVTGCTYNALNDPPLNLPAEKTRTTLRTQTHKGEGFNELRFEDAKGLEEVYVHAQKDMNTEVLNDRNTAVGNNHTEMIGANQTITVVKDQNETIEGNQTLQVNLNQTETVDGNQVVTVKLNQAETVFIAKALSVGAGFQTTVGAAMNTTVMGAMNTSVGLAQAEQVGLTKNVMVAKSYSQTVGADKTVNVKDNIKFLIGESFEVVCGKSVFKMDKEGNITINGHEFSLGTTGEQYYKAGGDINIKGKKILEN